MYQNENDRKAKLIINWELVVLISMELLFLLDRELWKLLIHFIWGFFFYKELLKIGCPGQFSGCQKNMTSVALLHFVINYSHTNTKMLFTLSHPTILHMLELLKDYFTMTQND